MFSVQTTRFFFLSDRVITKRLLYDISPSHSKKLSSRTKADWKKNTFSIMQPVSGLLDVITKKGSSFVIDCGVYWKYKGRQRKNCTLCRMAYGECGIILIVKLRKRIWIVSPSRTRCCKSVMISIELAQQRAIETITARQMFYSQRKYQETSKQLAVGSNCGKLSMVQRLFHATLSTLLGLIDEENTYPPFSKYYYY